MNSFLHNIAQIYYDNVVEKTDEDINLSQVLFVFPNRRAGLFFRNEFRSIAKKNIFAPNITDINKLAESFAPFQKANDVELLIDLYKAYYDVRSKNLGNDEEIDSFDAFIGFGSSLLSDFNEVDKYLVNTALLFKNIADIKNTTDHSQFMSEAQIETLKAFWNHVNFSNKENMSFQKEFISLWDDMLEIYNAFKDALMSKGMAYEGMIYRYVVENILTDSKRDFDFERIVFIGFNSLTTTEEKIMRFFKSLQIADFYFDYPEQYSGKSAFASSVARNYHYNLKEFPSFYKFAQESERRMPKIVLHGTPSITNQALIASNIIDELHLNDEQMAKHTAILLSDESVLPNLLQALPNYVKKLNITMGYPLNLAPISSLIESVISMQAETSKDKKGNTLFYHKPLLNILSHPYIQKQFATLSGDIIKYVTRYNFIKISESELHKIINGSKSDAHAKSFFLQIFSPVESMEDFFAYLDALLNFLIKQFDDIAYKEGDNASANSYQFELEYIYQYQAYLIQLRNCLITGNVTIEKKTLSTLISRITSTLKVQFKGEPLEGLQLMGMLECRLIDFDNIILLGFNDDRIPGKKDLNSLIPYNLRCAYNMPTYENNDAIFAYNFYRMLYHAKNVSLIYDSRNEGAKSEISRFYYQIKYLMPETIGYDIDLKHILYNLPIRPKDADEAKPGLSITKTKDIMKCLNKYKQDEHLSASKLKDYISCPLKFYFSSIAKIKEPDEISETIQANVFGTIFHSAMEKFYKNNICARQASQLEIEKIVKEAFEDEGVKNKKQIEITGFNMLTFKIICKLVANTINYDCHRLPFKYIAAEQKINEKFDDVNFYGFIDRIDQDVQEGNNINIIDYKTSTKNASSFKLTDLFRSDQAINHEFCQILIYCSLYQKYKKNEMLRIKPNLYKVFSLAKQTKGNNILLPDVTIEVPESLMQPNLPALDDCSWEDLDNDKKIKITLSEYNDIKGPYEWMLRKTLKELFDPEIPFHAHTRNSLEACKFCPYKSVCDKEKEVRIKLFN